MSLKIDHLMDLVNLTHTLKFTQQKFLKNTFKNNNKFVPRNISLQNKYQTPDKNLSGKLLFTLINNCQT